MKNINVVILQTEWKNEDTLRTYSKMTPEGKGIWKNLVGITDIKQADLAIVIDYTIQELPKGLPVVYMGAHPPTCGGYRCYDNKDCVAKFDLRDTYGFGEWWIDWNYTDLINLNNPPKTKNLSCILSNKTQMPEHSKRRQVANEFCENYSEYIDIYGRIIPTSEEKNINKSYKGILGEVLSNNSTGTHTTGKTPALLPYRYSLEFDYFCECEHYFSERFLDALLLWAMPIYSGGKGVGKYLPQNCHIPINTYTVKPTDIIGYINSGFREEHIKDIEEARYLILNKLQMWARVEEGIKGKL